MIFLAVYASRIENGKPCLDTKARLDQAMELGDRNSETVIVLGAGVPSEKWGTQNFADIMEEYLISWCWPKQKIKKNPIGFDTITETEAMHGIIKTAGNGKIIAVTAWYQAPRVWLTWAIRQKRLIKVSLSWATYPWTNPFREIIKIPLIFFPEKVRGLLRKKFQTV